MPRLPLCLLLSAVAATQLRLDPHPPGAVLTLSCDGFATWSERFAGTRLLEMVRSRGFAELVAPIEQELAKALAALVDHPQFDTDAASAWWRTYSGRVRVVVLLEPSTPGDADYPEPLLAMSMVVGADGHTDLAAQCQQEERSLEGHATRPVTLAGVEWLIAFDGEPQVTAPRMLNDEVVVVAFSRGHERLAERLFTDQEPARDAAESLPPLRVEVDVGGLIDKLWGAATAEEDAEELESIAQVARRWFGRLGTATLTVAPAKPYVDFGLDLELRGERGGVFDVLAPVATALPSILAWMPRGQDSFSCSAIDLRKAELLVRDTLALVPDAPIDWQTLEDTVEAEIGIRLGPDLLAHVGRGLLVLGENRDTANAEETETEDLSAMIEGLDGLCFGLELDNGTAFGRALETALDHSGMLRLRKTDKYRDHDVHRLPIPLAGTKAYWSVTDRMFVLGIGDVGRGHLQGLLDGADAAARGEAPPALADEVAGRLAMAAPDPSGVSSQSMPATLDALAAVVVGLAPILAEFSAGFDEAMFDEEEPAAGPVQDDAERLFDPELLLDFVGKLERLLVTHKLEHIVSVSHNRPDRLIQHVLW